MNQQFLSAHRLFGIGVFFIFSHFSLADDSLSKNSTSIEESTLWVKSIKCESGAINSTIGFREGQPVDLAEYKLMTTLNVLNKLSETVEKITIDVNGSNYSPCMNQNVKTTLTIILEQRPRSP